MMLVLFLRQKRNDVLTARELAITLCPHLHPDFFSQLPCTVSPDAGKDAVDPLCDAGLIGTKQA
jgi:hypothetical protein